MKPPEDFLPRSGRGAETAQEETLLVDLRRLADTGVRPEHDLWPEIADRIAHRPQLPPSRPLADVAASRSVAALAAAAGLLGLAFGLWLFLTPGMNGDRRVLRTAAASLPPSAQASPELRAALASYSDERRLLVAAIERELRDHPPRVAAEVQANLAVIEGALREIGEALGEEGSPPLLLDSSQQMAALLERELVALRRVQARLAGAAPVERELP